MYVNGGTSSINDLDPSSPTGAYCAPELVLIVYIGGAKCLIQKISI